MGTRIRAIGGAAIALTAMGILTSSHADTFYYRYKPLIIQQGAGAEPPKAGISLSDYSFGKVTIGKSYSFEFSSLANAPGKDLSELSWAIVPPDAIPGLGFDPASGKLSGVPTALNGFTFDIVATHGKQEARKTYSIEVIESRLLARKIASGGKTNCAVTPEGAAVCWGFNFKGKLGNGKTDNSTVPVAVNGHDAGILMIDSGFSQTCSVTTQGRARCWGDNSYGQLGIGAAPEAMNPTLVSGLESGVTSISTGSGYTCAVHNKAAKCWGQASSGRLGNGWDNSNLYRTPQDVRDLGSGVASIVAGVDTTCALLETGGLKCWGNGGRIGNGLTSNSSIPVDVEGLKSGVVEVTIGMYHSCALTVAGGVKCWGWNASGQVGDGNARSLDIKSPVDVKGLSTGVASISAGDHHTCALMVAGGVKCWGANTYGNLGNGNNQNSAEPVDVVGLGSNAKAIASGEYMNCAIMAEGNVKCWGMGPYLGNGATSTSYTPVEVKGL